MVISRVILLRQTPREHVIPGGLGVGWERLPLAMVTLLLRVMQYLAFVRVTQRGACESSIRNSANTETK